PRSDPRNCRLLTLVSWMQHLLINAFHRSCCALNIEKMLAAGTAQCSNRVRTFRVAKDFANRTSHGSYITHEDENPGPAIFYNFWDPASLCSPNGLARCLSFNDDLPKGLANR